MILSLIIAGRGGRFVALIALSWAIRSSCNKYKNQVVLTKVGYKYDSRPSRARGRFVTRDEE